MRDPPTIAESIESVQKYEQGSRRWKELTDAVLHYIAKDSQPLYTVEKPGFNQLIKTFDKRYELPSRSYFSRTALPALYAKVRDDVKLTWHLPVTLWQQVTFGQVMAHWYNT